MVENIDFKINALIDAGKAATTLGELRTNLRQLSDLAAEVGPNNVEALIKSQQPQVKPEIELKTLKKVLQHLL